VQWHLGQKSPAYLPSHRGYDRYYGYYQGVMDYWTHSATAAAGDPVRAHTYGSHQFKSLAEIII
jgi:arylsulfatase A-like enzyme